MRRFAPEHVLKGSSLMNPSVSTSRSSRPAARTLIVVLTLSGLVAACNPADRIVTGTVNYPFDHRERHPIVLGDGARTIDIFTGRGIEGLDARQHEDVRSFGIEYVAMGKGGIRAMVPQGQEGHSHLTMSGIRKALVEGGYGGGPISIGYYRPQDPSVAAPIRLTFVTLKATVASVCGQWPADLGSGPSIQGWRNNPYWNLGCATQTNMAAQIADPLDLVRSRPEGRIDTLKRSGGIEKLRQAKDPSTQYNQSATQINTAVGN
jgi:pilus assembly protein CpaD